MIRISKLAVILIILVLLGPIIDLLTGYVLDATGQANAANVDAITPGIIYRGIFLIPVFLLLAHLVKSPTRLILYYFGIVFFLGLLFRNSVGQDFDLVRNSQRYLKLMLPIFGFAGMLFIGQRFAKNKPVELFWRTAALYGGIAAFGLLTTDWLGLALNVYRNTNVASAGLIDSQNAASLILMVSLPIALHYVDKYQDNRVILVLAVQGLWLAAAFRLSTRAALVAIPIVIILHHIVLLIKRRYSAKGSQTVSLVALVILMAIVGFFILQNWASRDIALIAERFGRLAEGHFRNRVPIGIAKIQAFTFIEHLFGLGDRGFATTENDIVDIYGKFGLTVLIPILLFASYFFIRLLNTFLRYKRLSTFALLMSYSLYFIHSATAGHALLSSPINNLFLLIYFLSYLETSQLQPVPIPENKPSKTPLAPARASLTQS